MNNELEIKCTSCLKHRVKKLISELKHKRYLCADGFLEKELLGVLKSCGDYNVLFEGKGLFLGGKIAALEEISTQSVIALLENTDIYLTNDEFVSLLWQCKFSLLEEAIEKADESSAAFYIKRLHDAAEIDAQAVTEAVSPLAQLFSTDEIYNKSNDETKAEYRRKTAEIALESGIDEHRLSMELKARAEREEKHIGELIYADYRRVFHPTSVAAYLWAVLVISKVIASVIGFFTSWWCGLLAYLPCIAITKPLCDIFAARFTRRGGYLPRLELNGRVPKTAKTAVVLSSLITDEKSVMETLERLKQAKIRNRSENISFCLLCDLPASNSETDEKDNAVIASLSAIKSKILPEAVIFVRKRTFSKTQRKWQGRERKRGAIDELIRFFSGEEISFLTVCGDSSKLVGTKYLAALDYDTLPLLDSISELVSIALHPLNKKYGIIAPRISSSLSSTLRTRFSRLMGGNGGVSGISAYDSASCELYSDCFGEGIFTGKGLIDVAAFYEKTRGVVPDERVLSHDIIEGGLLNVIYAGDVEFYDSFPPTSKAFFKRLNRWIRGDFQNVRFIFYKQFSALTKFKLYDNIVRGLVPIFAMLLFFTAAFIENGWLALLTALVALLMTYLPSMFFALSHGFGFGLKRRFYSPIIPETSQLAMKALLSVMTLPYSALVSLDALIKTIWRLSVSKKNLLQWTTSGMLEKTAFGGWLHFLPSLVLSLALLFCAVYGGNVAVLVFSVLMVAGVPFLMYIDREKSTEKMPLITSEMRKNLMQQVEKMWGFYRDFATAENSFLPPDNVQQRPVYRIARRTSPTNIGFYLLSAVCVNELKIINDDELFKRVSDTLETVEKLEKWNGNLFNWYDTVTLNKLSGFVSTVDSGNFLCCMVAVKEALKRKNADYALVSRVEKLISSADLKPFYNARKKLFSIGFDTDKNALSEHHYDMLMSEARMTGYYAVADGVVPKSHWRALSRTMSKSGRFAGPVAWTGTMFEFYMPELLLKSKEGSLSYEALRYALYCQKRRFTPWGISESGYYAFDKEMNYQYKAHGVQKIALKSGMNKERVISPYASYLALGIDAVAGYNNLAVLERDGAYDEKHYGFYEAVDYTVKRVGRNACAVVKSHMAHHIGMSIVGAANALENNVAGRYFMSDEKMQSAEELLEERVMAGEKILDITDFKDEPALLNELEKISEANIENPRVNILSNSIVSVFTSDVGVTLSTCAGKDIVRRTDDILRRPHGEFFAYLEAERTMPFLKHPYLEPENAEYTVTFSGRETLVQQKYSDLRLEMKTTLCGDKSAYIRHFSAENLTKTGKSLTLCAYIEPSLSKPQDVAAHPMFADFFLKVHYDRENKLFIASRKSRTSDNVSAVAIGFTGEEDFTFSLDREDVLLQNEPLSFFHSGNLRQTSEVSVPSPCIFIKALIPLDALETRSSSLFTAFSDSEESAVKLALSLRKKPALPDFANLLSRSSIQGALAAKVAAQALYGRRCDRTLTARENLSVNKRALWRYGISGDLPIVLYDCGDGISALRSSIIMRHSLSLCGMNTDLAVLCENSARKITLEQRTSDVPRENVHFIDCQEADENVVQLLYAVAVCIEGADVEAQQSTSPFLKLLPSLPAKSDKEGFNGETFTVAEKSRPWCNILCNMQFGTLVSQNALGFSWAMNSRENKLTPWFNDIMNDNNGEMLLLKQGDALYDIVRGSTAVFSPNTADYESVCGDLSVKTAVRVYETGLGKELTVTVENHGSTEADVSLSYYAEGVLGTDRSAGFIAAKKSANGILFSNPLNPYYKGTAFISCSKKHRPATDRTAFFRGENIFKPCGDAAIVTVPLKLPPRSREKIRYILGYTLENDKADEMAQALDGKSDRFEMSNKITIKTPDEKLDALFNHWLPWQALGCRLWGRTGFYQNGGAYGFRDQLQDSLAIAYFEPKEAERQILRACSSQFIEGDVLHWWHELGEIKNGIRTRYSDDLLWLPYVAAVFSEMYGNGIWGIKAPYVLAEALPDDKHELFVNASDSEVKESVYLHCKKAMEKGFCKGKNGLLKIGGGDWNDGYNEVGKNGSGTSVWLSMFYVMCGRKFAAAARENNDATYAEKLEKRLAELSATIEETAWDGDYYLRAFYDNGEKMGAKGNACCEIDLLPQAFAALAELPDTKKTVHAVNEAINELVDAKNGIIKLFTPAFSPEKTTQRPGYVMSYPEGIRENGGQYTHAAIWLALACFKLGQKNRAFELLQMINPAKKGARYKNEPYYISADIYTNPDCYGRGGWSMYTGSAAWYYKLILEGLFGVEMKGGKVTIKPALPKEFDGSELVFTINKTEITAKFRFSEGTAAEAEPITLDGKKHMVTINYSE